VVDIGLHSKSATVLQQKGVQELKRKMKKKTNAKIGKKAEVVRSADGKLKILIDGIWNSQSYLEKFGTPTEKEILRTYLKSHKKSGGKVATQQKKLSKGNRKATEGKSKSDFPNTAEGRREWYRYCEEVERRMNEDFSESQQEWKEVPTGEILGEVALPTGVTVGYSEVKQYIKELSRCNLPLFEDLFADFSEIVREVIDRYYEDNR
jgi:hypothetical protein